MPGRDGLDDGGDLGLMDTKRAVGGQQDNAASIVGPDEFESDAMLCESHNTDVLPGIPKRLLTTHGRKGDGDAHTLTRAADGEKEERMARSTRTAAAKPVAPARKRTTLGSSPAKKGAVVPVEAPPAKTRRGVAKSGKSAPAPARKVAASSVAPKVLPTPKLSKDELKAQVEKLERSVATLRAKSRDMTRAAKTASARIAELEADVTRLENVVAQAQAAAKPTKQPVKRKAAPRPAKMSRETDVGVGDTVPPDVAAENQSPSDERAETAPNGLEESLSAHT